MFLDREALELHWRSVEFALAVRGAVALSGPFLVPNGTLGYPRMHLGFCRRFLHRFDTQNHSIQRDRNHRPCHAVGSEHDASVKSTRCPGMQELERTRRPRTLALAAG